ncbi:hypothetical protein Ancab_020935 [Ancistrocladus abbreviatus]
MNWVELLNKRLKTDVREGKKSFKDLACVAYAEQASTGFVDEKEYNQGHARPELLGQGRRNYFKQGCYDLRLEAD